MDYTASKTNGTVIRVKNPTGPEQSAIISSAEIEALVKNYEEEGGTLTYRVEGPFEKYTLQHSEAMMPVYRWDVYTGE